MFPVIFKATGGEYEYFSINTRQLNSSMSCLMGDIILVQRWHSEADLSLRITPVNPVWAGLLKGLKRAFANAFHNPSTLPHATLNFIYSLSLHCLWKNIHKYWLCHCPNDWIWMHLLINHMYLLLLTNIGCLKYYSFLDNLEKQHQATHVKEHTEPKRSILGYNQDCWVWEPGSSLKSYDAVWAGEKWTKTFMTIELNSSLNSMLKKPPVLKKNVCSETGSLNSHDALEKKLNAWHWVTPKQWQVKETCSPRRYCFHTLSAGFWCDTRCVLGKILVVDKHLRFLFSRTGADPGKSGQAHL